MKKVIFITTLCFLTGFVSAQLKPEIVTYVNQYKDVAIEEMVRTGIPASITLAQGILESGCGLSDLSRKANNHFGIKCKDEWTGKKFYQTDDAPDECFRVYESARESYADHSDFLVTRPRYADLFKLPEGDYKSWAHGLKAAGYATNPKYAPILINYIEDYGLHEYDRVGYTIINVRKTEKEHEVRAPKTEPVTSEVKPVEDVKHASTGNASATKNAREEFMVNGLRAVKATPDEDPFVIALEYNIDYQHILLFNDLVQGERFKASEYVFLQPKRNKAEESTHTVKANQSMRDIAQLYGIKLKDLYYKNLMKANDQAQAGEKIYLRDKRTSSPKTISYSSFLKLQQPVVDRSVSANTDDAYQVQPKDTLYSIAKKFNTSVEKIKELNNIDDSHIKPGQTLVVSE